MELYKVVIQYRDVVGEEYWNRRMEKHCRSSSTEPFSEPMPPPKTGAIHVAVPGGFGGNPVGRAGDLAIEGVVGADADAEKWQPFVLSVEHVGTVMVDDSTK
jgi:hypothetical protein